MKHVVDQETLKAIKQGEISPQQVVDSFEQHATHIKDIPVDNLIIHALPCGFPTLDDYKVFKKDRGELIIVGARPSQGKSAFIFQVATQVAQHSNVLIYSLEMNEEDTKARMIAANSGLSLKNIQDGLVPQKRINEESAKLDKLNFWVDDRDGLDIGGIVSSAIDHHRKHHVDLVVVDYLQQIRSVKRDKKTDEVGDITRDLKQLAKKLNCPVLVASQLNRKMVDRGLDAATKSNKPDFTPQLSDLRDSGNIEQDADVVIFLSRPEAFKKDYRVGEVDVTIAKQRNRPTGQAVFKWLGASTRFLDVYRGEEI